MAEHKDSIEHVLEGISYKACRGASDDIEIDDIVFSSRDAHEGAAFFCVVGTAVDGHDFAADAVARDASVLIVEHELDLDVPQFIVSNARMALAYASAAFKGHPSEHLRLVGITGTNGKTTTSFLVEHMARTAHLTTGLMGTVECHVGDEVRPSLHTTPESRDLQFLLGDMVDAGVDVAALEVSSHAIDLERIAATRFEVAAFTNLTQDHLDYHKTMENYFCAKARLFTDHEVGHRVICVDGEYGARLAAMCKTIDPDVITVGSSDKARIRVLEAEYAPHSTALTISFDGEKRKVLLPLVGRFNVENALVCAGIGIGLGFSIDLIIESLESAPQVPGRLERVSRSDGRALGFGVLVDYAHTPDSIEKALSAVRAVTPGRVICVFGCGGDRDATKRPLMGKAACAADLAIVTSDNPRTEDPDDIIAQILPGMGGAGDHMHVEADREAAIRYALQSAHEGDCVLIAGKGHEDYQIVGTEKHDFDDRLVAREELDRL